MTDNELTDPELVAAMTAFRDALKQLRCTLARILAESDQLLAAMRDAGKGRS
jgi:hypothetical protein